MTSAEKTITADQLTKGAAVLYPCWEGPVVVDQPRTAAAFIEYPETRVVYWSEGGYAVIDRAAKLVPADTALVSA